MSTRIHASHFYVLFGAPLVHLLLLVTALTAISGCTTSKQTWTDWKTDAATTHQVVHVAHTFPASEAAPTSTIFSPGYAMDVGARTSDRFDLAMRNPDFPRTYIKAIHIDLTGPNQWVHVQWTGAMAEYGPDGPWHSTPGRGQPEFDCDDVQDSNTVDSFCTPKGTFLVAGFADHLTLTPQCTYVTWILHAPRFIAMHGHTKLPAKPASSGCVRLPVEAAKLIHNNSIAGVTLVVIDGKWTRPQ